MHKKLTEEDIKILSTFPSRSNFYKAYPLPGMKLSQSQRPSASWHQNTPCHRLPRACQQVSGYKIVVVIQCFGRCWQAREDNEGSDSNAREASADPESGAANTLAVNTGSEEASNPLATASHEVTVLHNLEQELTDARGGAAISTESKLIEDSRSEDSTPVSGLSANTVNPSAVTQAVVKDAPSTLS